MDHGFYRYFSIYVFEQCAERIQIDRRQRGNKKKELFESSPPAPAWFNTHSLQCLEVFRSSYTVCAYSYTIFAFYCIFAFRGFADPTRNKVKAKVYNLEGMGISHLPQLCCLCSCKQGALLIIILCWLLVSKWRRSLGTKWRLSLFLTRIFHCHIASLVCSSSNSRNGAHLRWNRPQFFDTFVMIK